MCPSGDLVLSAARTKYRWAMQTRLNLPHPPNPARLWSGRVLPTSRSHSSRVHARIVIGDADGVFRRALRASFASDPHLEVVGEADDGEHALQLLRSLRPDVALIDGDLPSFGGAAIARIVSSELPETRVVVLTRSLTGVRR